MNSIKKRFAFYLTTSYLIVFLFPLVVCIHLFHRHTTELQNNIQKNNQIIVDNISQNFNNLLTDLEHELRSLSFQTLRIQNLRAADGIGNPTNFNQLHLQLLLKSQSNPILDFGYIFLFDSKKVITPFVAGNAMENFYNSYFQYEDMSENEFIRYFTDNLFMHQLLPPTELMRNHLQGNWTVYAQSLSNDPYEPSKGIILFILNFDYIKNLMENSLPEDSVIYLYYQAGETEYLMTSASFGTVAPDSLEPLICQSSLTDGTFPLNIQNQKYYVSQKSESVYGIRVLMAQSSKSALSALASFQFIIYLQMFAAAGVALLIIYYNTKKNVNSVKMIMDTFSSVTLNQDEMRDVYAFIQNAASKTIGQNLMLKTYVDKQQAAMAETFFFRLIHGDYLYETNLLQDMEELNIPMNFTSYTTVLCNICFPRNDGFAMKSTLSHQIKEQLQYELSVAFQKNVYILDYDISNLVLIFGTNGDTESLKHSIHNFFTALSFPVAILVCGGSPVNALLDISRSYREARYVSSNTEFPDSNCEIRWYTEIYENPVLFHYQDNYLSEQNLLNQILTGNPSEVNRLFESICQTHMEQNGSSPKAVRCLAYDLYRLANYVLSMCSSNAHIQAAKLNQKLDSVMLDESQFSDFMEYISQLYLSISIEKQNEKAKRGNAAISQAVDYIMSHYQNPQLSISNIADYCGLSTKYLSHSFKEQKNENISTFLERVRIEKACEYLKGTTYTINEISEKVGYTTPHTFRTAFKRCMFITPREYRDML